MDENRLARWLPTSDTSLVEASTEIIAGAAAGSMAATFLGVSSLVGSALFPLGGAIALPLLVGGLLKRKVSR